MFLIFIRCATTPHSPLATIGRCVDPFSHV
jgi:hypothetical protein